MITAGVDLAAEAKKTAIAVIVWSDAAAEVQRCEMGGTDGSVVEVVRLADKVGVDCPFGWPVPFVELVTAHAGRTFAAPPSSGRDWRNGHTQRETDRDVRTRTGLTPLSVSADKIGHIALRWAAIASGLSAAGFDTARDGSGITAEVYPAAALKLWGLPHSGYKDAKNHAQRNVIVDGLMTAAPWLILGNFEAGCRASDDQLDAVLSALLARAVATGRTHTPGPTTMANIEGWIHLPKGPLSEVIRP